MESPLKHKTDTFDKGRDYITKHGCLRLFCRVCNSEFICSGQCLFDAKYNSKGKDENSCICGKCDIAKEHSKAWYNKCQKDFPYSWIHTIAVKEEWK